MARMHQWRAAFGGSRRMRRKARTQWVISTQGFGGVNLPLWTAGAGGGVQAASLLDTSTTPSTLGDPQLDRFTVQRIVGDAILSCTVAPNADSQWFLHMGLFRTEVNASSGALIFDPSSNADADFAWLVQRHYLINIQNATTIMNSAGTPQLVVPDGGHFDIRVKRVMRPNERLFFAARLGSVVGGGAATLIMTPFFRTLVTRAI